MPHSKVQSGPAQENRAAVLIDFDDAVSTIVGHTSGRLSGTDLFMELVDEVRQRVAAEGAQTVSMTAIGDFTGEINEQEEVLKRLYFDQVEVRHLCSRSDAEATVMQMGLEAADLAYTRPDVNMIVLVAGNRSYYHVANWLRRRGKRVIMSSVSWPEDLPANAFTHWKTLDMFSDATRRQWQASAPEKRWQDRTEEKPAAAPAVPRASDTWEEITDQVCRDVLRIIEEYFGQYEEVYLTPLLRKISEAHQFDDIDPKTLISELEEAGAVWLEKRRGFPHDYTVLLVNADHPSVREAKQEYEERLSEQEFGDYEYEEETEDSYDERARDTHDIDRDWN